MRVQTRFRFLQWILNHDRVHLGGKCHNQKAPKCQSSSQDVPFPWFSSHYVFTVSDQVQAKVDLIKFLITTEPSLGKQTLEKVPQSDVSISLVCRQVAAQVSVATIISQCYSRPLFLEVCVQWLW